MISILLLALLGLALCYNRSAAVSYAGQWWNSANHSCSSGYESCTPYAYYGSEHCGYSSHGGDCANFVSQCLLAGGHSALNLGGPCRGYPCGVEEVSAKNLGDCLAKFGHQRTCGYQAAPPSWVSQGDVLIYHANSCDDYTAHATIVVGTGSSVTIACHSSAQYGVSYTYLGGSHPYYEWIHVE